MRERRELLQARNDSVMFPCRDTSDHHLTHTTKGTTMKNFKAFAIATALLATIGVATPCFAESMQYDDEDWHVVSPTFYLWLFQVDGNLTGKGPNQDVNLSMGDVMEDMTSFQLYLELNKGDWGGFVEPTFIGYESEEKKGGVKFKTDADLMLVDLAATYRFWQTDDPAPMSFFALAGARYWNFDFEVDGKGAAAPDSSEQEDLIDPFIGARLRMDISDKLHLGSRLDIGGFRISSLQSDLTWQTWLLLSYDVTRRFAVMGGYRALALDYEDGSGGRKKEVDLVFHGPVLGFNFDIFGWLADRRD